MNTAERRGNAIQITSPQHKRHALPGRHPVWVREITAPRLMERLHRGDDYVYAEIPHSRRRRLQGLLPRGGRRGRAETIAAAWIPECQPHVSRSDTATRGPLPHRRA